MNKLFSYNEFLDASYPKLHEGMTLSGFERLATDDEIKDMRLTPEKESLIISTLRKIKPFWDKLEEIKDEIQNLIVKRDANRGEKWEDFQPQIQQLAGKRDFYEGKVNAIQGGFAKETKEKYVAKYFYVIEK